MLNMAGSESLLNIPKSCLEVHLLLPFHALPQSWPGRGIAFPRFMNSHCGAGLGLTVLGFLPFGL